MKWTLSNLPTANRSGISRPQRAAKRGNYRRPSSNCGIAWRMRMARVRRDGFARPTEITARPRRKVQQTGLLLQIATKVAAAETLEELLRYIVEVSVQQTGAERGTLFLNDEKTNELYSRVAQGVGFREIRLVNDTGIAGHVFKTGEGIIIDDAYTDSRFNRSIDADTGFITRNLLCAPIATPGKEIIGVLQILNKRSGTFTRDDLELLES